MPTPVLKRVGANTATWFWPSSNTPGPGPTVVFGMTQWSGLPDSCRMKTLLTRPYASRDEFCQAWGAQGGDLSVVATTFEFVWFWLLAQDGTPSVRVLGAGTSSLSLKLSLAYSAAA